MIFLEIEDVLRLYSFSTDRFGGFKGVRDLNLLESAISQVKMAYKYEKADVFHLGATYIFCIIKNHPFIDGNKRVGLLAALSFLEKNNIVISCDDAKLYELVISIASASCTVNQIANFLENHSN